MEPVGIPPRSLFICHKYFQHAGSEWPGEHCITYHSYLIPENHGLPDKTALARKSSIDFWAERHSLTVERGLDQQAGDSDEQPHFTYGFRSSS